ncbi:calcium/calmodulin-dependent protein kinase [Neofusicoccum parvum]|nr:calcium/calmodulin-dependent protein kinase [Neofusicoccum parvum]
MGHLIGIGVSSNVCESVDVDSGRLLTVKTIDAGTHSVQDIERELAILKSLWHPNILEFIVVQANGSFFEIITPLKHGNVRDLIKQGVFLAQTDVISTLTHHMLQALDYISIRGIVHRDIKPQNILYRNGPGFLF